MNILLYVVLFIIGIGAGVFCQTAIYRIPRNIKIMKKGVTNIEPEGKQKISKKIIKISYEILIGILFVLFGKALGIDINSLKLSQIIMYIFTIVYLTTLFIIAGIDKKHINIDKKVTTFGVIVSMIYIVYSYTIDPSSIYFNTVCLGLYIILLVVDTIFLRKYAQNSYTIGMLMLVNMMLVFSEVEIFAYTIAITAIEILLYLVKLKINQKNNGNKKVKIDNVPVGYFLSISNIIILCASAITQIVRI